MNGLSLGTFAAALHLAPDAPIPRELLYAITAAVLPGTYISEEEEATDLIELEPFFAHSAAVLAEATVEHLVEAGVLEYAEDDMVRLNPRLRPVGNGPLDRMGLALSVAFLPTVPDDAAQQRLLGLQTPIDAVHVHGREVYRRCRTKVSDSTFSGARLEQTLGMPTTMRNITTVRRLAAKCGTGA